VNYPYPQCLVFTDIFPDRQIYISLLFSVQFDKKLDFDDEV
jgi:hypothetical protein